MSGSASLLYPRAWRVTVCLLAVIGCLAASLVVPLTVDAVLFVMVAAVVGCIKFTADCADDTPASASLRSAVRLAFTVAAAVLAVCGYAAAAGASALTLLALVVATSPPVAARWYRPNPRPTPVSRAEPTMVVPTVLDEEGPVDDLELCRAWRRSYLSLQSAASIDERLRIVARRQSYLDELERRAPQQLAEWLHTGARAAGDPTRFICGDAHRDHQK